MTRFVSRQNTAGSLAIAILALVTVPSHAASTSTTFTVSATVADSCQNLSAGNIGFSTYDPVSGSASTNSSTISVKCTNATSYAVKLNAGVNGTISQRKMKDTGSTNTLNYNLYSDSSHTTLWGDDITGSSVSQTGNGGSQNMTVYGKIPADENAATNSGSDTYRDTLTVTVEY